MYSAFDISSSGLVAQRLRLDAISSNIANISTTRNEFGQIAPYEPRYVTFQTDSNVSTPEGGEGVRVSSVEFADVPPILKYDPGHPDANVQGYVAYPNIDMTNEFVDALEATRAYEANVGVLEITKDLAQQTLRLVA